MKYNAFISYSHSQDSDLAPSLEKALEKFAKPTFKRRALNIFRDSNDLSVSPDLWGKIEEGLEQSEYFIYFASPKSANSHYCNEEVKYWLENKSMDQFLLVLTDGNIIWDFKNSDFDWNKTDAIPKVLSGAFKNEPLYVDFRGTATQNELNLDNPDFKTKVVLLAATLHGKAVGDMVGEAVKQHKRTLMLRNGAVAIVMALMSLTILLTMISNRRKSASILHFQAKAIESTNPTLALRLEQEALNIYDYPEFEKSALEMINRNAFYRIIASRDTANFVAMDISKQKMLLLGGDDGMINLLDQDGTLIREFKIEEGGIRAAKFAPDGMSFLIGSDQGAHLWDLGGNLKMEYKLDTDENPEYIVTSVDFAPDGQTILTGSFSGAHLWDLDGQRIPGFEVESEIASLAFAPDGNSVLIGYDGSKRAADLFDLQGNPKASFSTDDANYGEPWTTTNRVAFSADGQTILVCSSVNRIQLFTPKGDKIRSFDLPYNLNFVTGPWTAAISADGNKVLTSSFGNTGQLWDRQGKLIKEFKGHEAMINLVAFDPTDDQTIFTGSQDQTIRKWYMEGLNASILKEFSVQDKPVTSIDIAPDNKSFMTSTGDSIVSLWDFNKNLLKQFNHKSIVKSLAFSPDGKTILTKTANGVHVWNLNADLLQEQLLTDDIVAFAAFSADSKSIVLGTAARTEPDAYLQKQYYTTIRKWDWKKNAIQDLEFGDRVWLLKFAPGRKAILTYGDDGTFLWDLEGKLIQEFEPRTESEYLRALIPDGYTKLSFSYPDPSNRWDKGSPTVRIQDLKGSTLSELHRPGKYISAIDLSPDGNIIIAGFMNAWAHVFADDKDCTLAIYKRITLNEFLDAHVAPLSSKQKEEIGIN